MIFKVVTEKVLFVEADNVEGAEECVFDDDVIMCDERIVTISKARKCDIKSFFCDDFGG